MKLYVYIFKRLDLKRFEIFKNIPSNCRPQFSDFSQRYRLYYYYFSILRLFFYITAIFFSKILAILLRVLLNGHIKCIVCICVSFLYICLTSETLHYPWIPSYTITWSLPVFIHVWVWFVSWSSDNSNVRRLRHSTIQLPSMTKFLESS